MCYDHMGHGFFIEDGAEEGNVLAHNLGLGTKAGSGKLVPSDAIGNTTGGGRRAGLARLLLLVAAPWRRSQLQAWRTAAQRT